MGMHAIITTMLMAVMSLAISAAERPKVPTSSPAEGDPIRVLIVTGGHPFQRAPFFAMFKGHPDIRYKEVVHPEAQAWFDPDKSDEYDVMVWFDMWSGEMPETAKQNLLDLLKQGKPLVVLHHALNTYKDWPEADRIIGAEYYFSERNGHPKSNYTHDVRIKVEIADPRHPITMSMKDFEIVDEVYGLVEVSPGVKPLLKTDHAKSLKLIGWTHTYGRSPVVFIQPGHGPEVYSHPSYRQLVIQSIRWAAGKLPPTPERCATQPATSKRPVRSAQTQAPN